MRMINRRQALGAFAIGAMLPASTAVAPVAATAVPATELDPAERVRRSALALADALKALHGGSWSIQISHKSGFVAVSRDFDS